LVFVIFNCNFHWPLFSSTTLRRVPGELLAVNIMLTKVCVIHFCWYSPYKRALRQIKSKDYGDIIQLCTDEIDIPSSTHMAEALLLRATFYLLRGEMNCAMDDFEQLLAMDGVDKHVSVLKPVSLIDLSFGILWCWMWFIVWRNSLE